jgi:RNA polymerase sigma-70 factor (ECF subfamily)
MPESSDSQLVEAAVAGNADALGQLLGRYQGRLYQVCLRMVSNRDDAAEVCQDAMLKIVEHIRDFRSGSAVSTWMIRIAMNLSISHLRKRKLRRTTSIDAAAPAHGSGANNGQDDGASAMRLRLADTGEPLPDRRVEHNEMVAQLHQALGRLEEDFRSVLVLRDIEEMDYQQIADTLSLPVGTVKSRLFRARLALRQELVEEKHEVRQ